ncbi:hypothetical protein Bbelb_358110 [Branchiostoma belcheri]|nr:hypothetical protein Bbelb_358110 [Branchiostoma belcheri]
MAQPGTYSTYVWLSWARTGHMYSSAGSLQAFIMHPGLIQNHAYLLQCLNGLALGSGMVLDKVFDYKLLGWPFDPDGAITLSLLKPRLSDVANTGTVAGKQQWREHRELWRENTGTVAGKQQWQEHRELWRENSEQWRENRELNIRPPDTTHADDMVTRVQVPDTTHADDMVTHVRVPDTTHADDMVTHVRVPDTTHADDMVTHVRVLTRHMQTTW